MRDEGRGMREQGWGVQVVERWCEEAEMRCGEEGEGAGVRQEG